MISKNNRVFHTHPAPRGLHDVLPGQPALREGAAALSLDTAAHWGLLTPRCGRVLSLEVWRLAHLLGCRDKHEKNHSQDWRPLTSVTQEAAAHCRPLYRGLWWDLWDSGPVLVGNQILDCWLVYGEVLGHFQTTAEEPSSRVLTLCRATVKSKTAC